MRAREVGQRLVAALLPLVLIAAACAASTEVANVTPAETVEPVRAPAPTAVPEPAAEETQTPATPTVAPTPSPTPEPSPTPVPTPSPTPVPTPSPTATAVPVVDVLDVALAASQLVDVSCPAEAQAAQVSCLLATLPVDVRSPDASGTVELMVALVDNGDPLGIGPVVYFQGGPGVGATANAPRFVGAQHNVLLVDQRGSGFSSPNLDCPEVDGLWQAQRTDNESERRSDEQIYGAYEECSDRLVAEGISLNDFNTTAAATDFELIRRLLGYESWSLWGISYGTRTALTVMRDHPDGVRAAVLDSVVPFEVDFFATLPENALRSLEALDRACDATSCATDHGDFFTNLSDLTLRLNDVPVVVTATRPTTGETFPFRVDGSELISLVFTQLYSTRSLPSLPRQISRSDFGGIEELVASYVQRRDPNQVDLAEGLYYTTWCREEFPFHDSLADDSLLVEVEPLFGSALEDALSSEGTGRLCEFFAVDPADASYDQAVQSDIPTVVFAGAFDPVTPPEWSSQVAQVLSNATYVELADHGHGMSTACPRDLRNSFLVNPTADLDTSCVNEVAGPSFD